MTPADFTRNFRQAFGPAELPLAFGYTDDPAHLPAEPARGCFFQALKTARAGQPLTLDADVIKCGGGKLYTGFADPSPRIDEFVSLKEKYKQTPQLVHDFVQSIGMPRAEKPYLRFTPVDRLETFDGVEGLMFFATPDVLSGLVGWAVYDTNAPDAVSAPFGSGCSSMVAQTVAENRRNGHRCFLGLFDPSVRPAVEADVLGFSMPLSRFRVMSETMTACFLGGGPAWNKVRERIASAAR